MYFTKLALARNLYVAVQPTVTGAGWQPSKMDFRSNEAGRTELELKPGLRLGRVPSGQTQFR
jgi:hypothetical protein